MRLPRLVTDAPRASHGVRGVFSLAQGWFARRGAGCLVLVPVSAHGRALVMSGLVRQRAGVISQ